MKKTIYTIERIALGLCGVVVLVVLSACSTPEHSGNEETGHSTEEEIRDLQSRFAEHNSGLQRIADEVTAWKTENKVSDSERDLLLSLFTRRLAFHRMEPSDSSRFGRGFQQIELRIAQYRRSEYQLTIEFEQVRDRLDSIAQANSGDIADSTLETATQLAALPFMTCPNPDGCPDPGGPRKPCDPFIFDPGRVCYLVYEDCQPTFPLGSGWMQQCRYRCLPMRLLF